MVPLAGLHEHDERRNAGSTLALTFSRTPPAVRDKQTKSMACIVCSCPRPGWSRCPGAARPVVATFGVAGEGAVVAVVGSRAAFGEREVAAFDYVVVLGSRH